MTISDTNYDTKKMEALKMPKRTKELSALEVKRLIRPGRHAVGTISGLLLAVKDTGAKSWILRTMVGGKRRNIGLGSYPEVSLAEAKERARDTKEKIRQGIDPVEERRATSRALHEQSERMTFSESSRLCHEKKSPEFKHETHKKHRLNQ